MLKKIVLIALLSIVCFSSMLIGTADSQEVTDVRTKKRLNMSIWFKAVIPNVLACSLMQWIIHTNRDNPEGNKIVEVADVIF